jgi:GTP diphosphokinase / guanosine-3',5'-bis(diphosphate) 3'-diphosphatase
MNAETSEPPAQVEASFEELAALLRQLRPAEDIAPLESAYRFALTHHASQKRASGEPYMIHPLAVSRQLLEMNLDMTCLVTGILHDVVEDTPVTIEEIRKLFGAEVAQCVDGVTKLTKLDFASREVRQAESVRKMLLAMVDDIRVILVKMADRVHNMRTLQCLAPDKQVRIAQETVDIYAPIAHRLGMGKVRAELEDLAFHYLEPDAANELVRDLETVRPANEAFLGEIKDIIRTKLDRENIPSVIESRVKRPYSVFQKLRRQKIVLDQVYDLLAVRIITDSVKNCYGALGMIHNEWRPIPGRIKDFIAIPRPNLYQSLHTSVVGPGGRHFEVQIRTEEMHRVAEDGIAAHWKYKEGRKASAADDDQRVMWLRQLVEWQRDMRDSGEFMSTLKVDLYPDEVYTFTPQGKVIVLPRGATPIDFAYAIHSQVGNSCTGARIGGRIVPLKYGLRNGDVVEIITQAGHMPSKDWLAIVKTSRARNKVRHFINATEHAKAVEIGEKYLEREARRLGVQMSRLGSKQLQEIAGEYGCSKSEDLLAALGFGKFSPRQILHKLAPELVSEETPEVEPEPKPTYSPDEEANKDLVIKVKGVDDLLLYLAKCCNPIKGEPIVGYVTRGKGIAVHSQHCSNVQALMYEVERKIEVEWARASQDVFLVSLLVRTEDRPGMLSQVTTALFQEQANIRTLETRPSDSPSNEGAVVAMTLEVKDKRQLERVSSALRRVAGVRDIERVHEI